MTPTTRKPVHIYISPAECIRAMDHLITAELTRRGYPVALINTTTTVARALYAQGHSAFRARHLAIGLAERLQLTRKPTNPAHRPPETHTETPT